jgi:hypothetical protein
MAIRTREASSKRAGAGFVGQASGAMARVQRLEQEKKERLKTRAEIGRDILIFVKALGGFVTSRLPPLPTETMQIEFPPGCDIATFVQVCRFHPRMVTAGIQTRWVGTLQRLLPTGRFADVTVYEVRIGPGDLVPRPTTAPSSTS